METVSSWTGFTERPLASDMIYGKRVHYETVQKEHSVAGTIVKTQGGFGEKFREE